MKLERITQVRSFMNELKAKQWNDEINFQDITKENAKNYGEIEMRTIETIIQAYILKNGTSLNAIDKTLAFLEEYYNVTFSRDASIVSQLAGFVVTNILLPNYVNTNDELLTETIAILERAENRMNKEIEKNNGNFFHIQLQSPAVMRQEFREFGFVEPRSINLGGVFQDFWIDISGCNTSDRMSAGFNFCVESTGKLAKKYPSIRLEDIIDVLYELWKVEIPGEISLDNPNEQINILMNMSNQNMAISIIPHDSHWSADKDYAQFAQVVFVSSKSISENDPDTSINNTIYEFTSHIEDFINLIAQKSGIKHHHRFLDLNKSILREEGVVNITWIWEDEMDLLYESSDANDRYHSKSHNDFKDFEKLRIDTSEKVTLNDIGGVKEAKIAIDNIIKSLKFPEIMKSWGAKPTSGMILEWPSGTGKTLLVRAIASEVDAEVYSIKLTDIASSAYINEGANSITRLFNMVKRKAEDGKNIIIILDELDALFQKRWQTHGSSEDTKIVNTFLTEMSGMDRIENVIFIGTTNLIDTIDPAVMRSGRLSTTIRVDLPDKDELKEIYQIHLKKLSKVSPKFYQASEHINLDAIVDKSIGFSGADIEEIIRILAHKKAMEEIAIVSQQEWMKENKLPKFTHLTEEDFIDAIKTLKEQNARKSGKKSNRIGF